MLGRLKTIKGIMSGHCYHSRTIKVFSLQILFLIFNEDLGSERLIFQFIVKFLSATES